MAKLILERKRIDYGKFTLERYTMFNGAYVLWDCKMSGGARVRWALRHWADDGWCVPSHGAANDLEEAARQVADHKRLRDNLPVVSSW